MLSFKQAVLGSKTSKKVMAPTSHEVKELKSVAAPSAATIPRGEDDCKAKVYQADAADAAAAATAVVDDEVFNGNTLVLLELNYIARTKADLSKNKTGEDADADADADADDESQKSLSDCTVLGGPEVFVEAKLHDVSTSNSTYGTDTEEGSIATSSGASSGRIPFDSASNSCCASVDNESQGGTTRASTPIGLVMNHQEASCITTSPPIVNGKRLFLRTPDVAPDLFSSGDCFTPGGGPLTPHEYNFSYPATPHEKVSIELDCPQKYVGRLIGKSGSTVRTLESKTGVSIQIDQNMPKGCPRKVTICGHPSLIDEAEKIVKEVIEFGPPELNKKNVYKMALNSMACENAKGRMRTAKRSLAIDFTGEGGVEAGMKQLSVGPDSLGRLDHSRARNTLPRLEQQQQQSAHALPPYYGLPPPPPPPPHMHPGPYFHHPGSMYVPAGYTAPGPHSPPSFKAVSTAAIAAKRFWSEHQTASGEKYYVNQYTGELMTKLA